MQKIIFYDGDCGFCNKSIQFVLKNESNPEIYFSALQSEFAINFFKEKNLETPDMNTFYFHDGKKMHERSSGAIEVLRYLKAPWKYLIFFRFCPKFIRDAVYDFFAKRRHKISAGFCMLPSPEQRKRFLK
jgi:predicted DCC family thiol-disulfide oxidoreductase YuxK